MCDIGAPAVAAAAGLPETVVRTTELLGCPVATPTVSALHAAAQRVARATMRVVMRFDAKQFAGCGHPRSDLPIAAWTLLWSTCPDSQEPCRNS
jgi:hypothetical protein